MRDTITLYVSSLTHHISTGRPTLQIPTLFIGEPSEGRVEYPASHFTILHDGRRTALGREQGYLFLSREGWEAHRDTLLAAWPRDPALLVDYAEKFYARVEEADAAERERRLRKLNERPVSVAQRFKEENMTP